MARRKTHPGSIDTLRSGSVRFRFSVAGDLERGVLRIWSNPERRLKARGCFRSIRIRPQ